MVPQLINSGNWHMVMSQSLGNHRPDVSYWFVADRTIEDAPACDAASRVAAAMFSELRVHAAANIIELFVQTLVVLKIIPILDTGLVTGLHDPLRQCG
ncbi:hypothetical protein TNCV_5008291 [Trichonephila clavipes]|nr:hypothetical protein TNCV_5008291 [Trichonephila clavipes]